MAAPKMGLVQVRVARWPVWLRAVIMGLLLVALLVDLARIWGLTNHHDLDVFVLAARRLAAGQDIYADAGPFKAAIEAGTFSMKDSSVVWPYAYPPLIAFLFWPLRDLPDAVIRPFWWGLNVIALFLGAWLCLRAASPERLRSESLVLSVALVATLLYRFEPAVVALRLGQIELLQFLLLAITLYALSRGQERWGGVTLGLAAGLKFFPAFLIGLLVWRRRWRAALWAAGTAGVAVLGSFAVVGFETIPAYLDYTAIYGIGGAFAAFPLNQSLNGFLSRNLARNLFSATLKGVNLPGVAKALTVVGDAAIVLSTAGLAWHRTGWLAAPDEAARQRFTLEFALAVVALLLVSPHSQVYTFAWLLLPLSVLALWLAARPRVAWAGWVGLAIAYLLVGRNYTLILPGLTRLVQAHYLWGALLLWGLLGAALWRQRAEQAAGGV